MKVFLSADIEGVTGVVSWSHCGRADGDHYDFPFARRMMTHDVNAAIRGAKRAGADTVVVKDSHGNSKSLLIDELEPGTELISGHGAGIDGMMEGIDSSFDAALLIGYHGMAGTLRGIMEHTITGGIHHVWVNGNPYGEMGLAAGVAGRHGVPTVCASSDLAGCAEFKALIPGARAAVVKEGFGRYMGKLLHPSVTGPLIENAVESSLKKFSAVEPVRFSAPTTIRVEFNRSEEADLCEKLQEVTRIDAFTFELTRSDFAEAHRALWVMIPLSAQGILAQR
jgi:D-amino peptidase